MRPFLLLTASMLSATAPAFAQDEASELALSGDIIVTATKRAEALSDVPIAISAVSGQSLELTGATDIRQLNQLSPSLLVSSTSSESGGGVARIRGIGTVGDNAGLESSVAVFIDGVYRSRSSIGLTELGEVERIEVLRGPQGTLFGRNASAGLINVVTARPSFEPGGTAELSYGNYDAWRLQGGLTGPIAGDKLAFRLDGIYSTRDGFITDVVSGRKLNGRDRWLVRGQLLAQPNDDLSIRLIGDYAKRDEECCAGPFQPFQTAVRDGAGNLQILQGNPVASLMRSLGANIQDDTFRREVSLTPGRSFRSDVQDWGVSGEVNWTLGDVNLTSITAWRDWKVDQEQDADFSQLDILERGELDRHFRTFSQELRLNGEAFNGRLDWLVGGYFAHEKLRYTDDLGFGADMDVFANALVRLSVPNFPGFAALRPFVQGALVQQGVPVAAATTIAGAVNNLPALANTGTILDVYDHKSRNYAFFTHNVFHLTDRLSLTLGARYTNERKTLDTTLLGNNAGCASIQSSIAALSQFNNTPLQPAAAGAAGLLSSLAAAPCIVSPIGSFAGSSVKKEDQWSGTAVLSWKPIDELLTYASYSRGYKAGGFNLDRSGLNPAAIDLDALKFEPEKVNSYEVGAKLDLASFRLNVAAFLADYDQFQLSTFNGINFIVENIQSCRDDLGGADSDFTPLTPNAAQTGACDPDRTRSGVRSKGVEVEASLFPAPDLAVNLGFTWADTRYRRNLVGIGGRPLAPPLYNLPGQQISNSPEFVQTGSIAWTPAINDRLGALVYVDYRYQSAINTGSDLFPEKRQEGFGIINARLGLTGPDRRWSIEGWVQNLLDTDYRQVVFNAPGQGSGSQAATARGGPNATQLFGAFLGEPRTYGVTVRTKF